MKYSVETEIDLHRDGVVALLTDHDKRRHWQAGFKGAEALEGTPGTVGATTKLTFQVGPQDFDMIETILIKDLPYEYCVSYVSSQSASISRSQFTELSGNRTLWCVDMEIKVSGAQKILAFFRPDTFRQQTQASMQSFANYAGR